MLKSKILLKNGEIVSSLGREKKDVLIEGGKIVGILEPGESESDENLKTVDCSGKIILPGLIDVHVHFREPGQSYKEDWETGSKSAVSGGVTTVFDMPNNQPPVLTVKDLDAKRDLIKGRSYVNYGLYMGYDGKNLDEVNSAKGVPGVKLYMANSTGDMGVSAGVRELFEKGNKLIVVHAEDEDIIERNTKEYLAEFEGREIDPAVHSKIRSTEAAASAVRQICELAKETGHPLHVAHISCNDELEIIEKFEDVTCEVTPHHLTLCDSDYEILGNKIKVNPPIREREDVFSMWKGVKMGEIDIIATDHAPHTLEEKEQGYLDAPSGVPGVGIVLPMLLTTVNNDGLTLEELVRICCERPAEIFKVKNKGWLKEGYDADIVVVDMDKEDSVKREKVFSKCGWSPYEDSQFVGWPVKTFVCGELVFDDGKIVGEAKGREADFSL
ncbi:MAG: dihydroorotase [bacterium]|nr:dihydroorotase [bacterium]